MFIRYIVVILLGFSSPALAQGLTDTKCAEIRAAYGVTPSECQRSAIATPMAMITPVGLPITEPTQEMRQNNVFFTQGGTELSANALLQLQRLAEVLNAPSMQRTCLRLVGYSDSSGSGAINMEVGAKRAAVVQKRLSLLLLNPARIEGVQSMGEQGPLAGLAPDSTWQRRVEIWARNCPGY
ncbi:OmpA family protein [uncultured Litoreibacter sp.]|uniref:OmpA family protein n=1 Tax=uncultured Litoreibacter sp. TaxID=1392394 RepID=UPI002634B89A|nr:OmpA family protein [uncultured Litoreibacter sp.]